MASEKMAVVLPVSFGPRGRPEHHDRVEAEQARFGAQHHVLDPAASRFDIEVRSDFLERDGVHPTAGDGPATGKGFDDLLCGQRDVCRAEVFVTVLARPVSASGERD